MVKVNFVTNDKSVTVEKGTTILEAARKIGIIIESPCNAVGVCGKCKVKVALNDLDNILQAGVHHLSENEKAQGFVLACAARVLEDVNVEILQRNSNKTLQILNHGESFDIELNSFVSKEYKDNGRTYVYAGEQIIGDEGGDTTALNYGIVVDIGTTTLVATLVDINTGEELNSVAALNPQSIYAQDVLSRIKFASDEKGLEVMYSSIIKEVNGMIEKSIKKTGIDKKYIYEAIFSGNTCMIHLAANVNPYSLGKYPYTPLLRGGNYLSPEQHKLNISDMGLIYLPPIISAYVGPDITSGILATRLQDRKGTTLFVDIGTNGEMVIARDGKLSSTSTAAGPAFEGMNITYGMRAERGAIEYFNIEADGYIEIKTIEDGAPIGICGSGLFDIVGELVFNKVIGKSGRFASPEKSELPEVLRKKLVKVNGKIAFEIAEGIFLTQKDIRQVQLAKGAIRAGIEFLMNSKKVKADEVDKIQIAGSFGYHLRAKSLTNIGLLPKEFEGKIDFVGNTSKSGGHAFLLNKEYRVEMEKLVKEIEVVELSNGENFDKIFVKSLSF
ncbi:ASKHA domain-containing protein [Clostridium algoriphilum]|uniref:ASKHA domain-containing protein n=1 Tax=Clostridium algoriphilum TaxID=198347 RepID=UPI001CF2B8B3|nr:ASKHA domain-containing protein [Clostridium algoriphilum]MCB2294847.1 ASKHA domain-containing protein [Clostridium algoriphilum]